MDNNNGSLHVHIPLTYKAIIIRPIPIIIPVLPSIFKTSI